MPHPISSGKSVASAKRQTFLVGFGLFLLTLFLYWPTIGYDFIVVDDDQYVFANRHVAFGLSWAGVKWAFTTLDVWNWHPLTWLSHMLDCSIWGLFSGGHHLTSVLFHCTNTVLLFLLLLRLTNAFWRSVLVAALFAWHPTHLESVAWICERKDVLSTFFLILTVWAYAGYVRKCGVGRYLLALLFFACGLMSKPMLVTLPCVLLLLDFWPLRRIAEVESTAASNAKRWSLLIAEKIPFFALSLADSLVTMKAQRGAMSTLQHVSLPLRVTNALGSYALYLEKAFLPFHLSVFYPLPAKPPVALAVLSGALIVMVSVALFWRRSRFPALLTGWLWFLGTLVPVLGLVQVGSQAMADRYTYIPYIGLFILLAWGVERLLLAIPAMRVVGCTMLSVGLAACFVWTRMQLPYWHDSIRLFTHALETTGSAAFTESNLSYALIQAGRGREAMPHFAAVLRVKPWDIKARFNYARELARAGQIDAAASQLSEALKYQPSSEKLHNSLGLLLAAQGKSNIALEHLDEAIRLDPTYPWPYFNRAVLFQRQGNAERAVTDYHRALQLQPAWPDAMDNLALLFAACPDTNWNNPAQALKLVTQPDQLADNASARHLKIRAYVYAANGAFSNAVTTAEQALQKIPDAEVQSKREMQDQLADYRAAKISLMNWTNVPVVVFNAP